MPGPAITQKHSRTGIRLSIAGYGVNGATFSRSPATSGRQRKSLLLSTYDDVRTEVAMPERLAGKIALVTGIGAEIGQGTALRFAAEGAVVIGCDINPASAEATVEVARRQGLELTSVH